MEKVLVSACLLGIPCRYDGKCVSDDDFIAALECVCSPVPFCPEAYGGLKTPRAPAEIQNGRVISNAGDDVTYEYTRGAREALMLCKRLHIQTALLKSRSPSCGKGIVYDGTFTGTLTDGDGVCARLLSENGIRVFSNEEFDDFCKYLQSRQERAHE